MTATVSGAVLAYRDLVVGAVASHKGPDQQPVGVTLGSPGQFQVATVVGVGMAVRSPIARPTEGTNRSREATVEIDSIISAYVAGDETAQQAANTEALAVLALIETAIRTSPNEKLGGNARDAFLSAFTIDVAVAMQAFDDPTVPPVATGRIAEITATVTAFVRY